MKTLIWNQTSPVHVTERSEEWLPPRQMTNVEQLIVWVRKHNWHIFEYITKVSNNKKHCRHTCSQLCGSHTKSTPSFWIIPQEFLHYLPGWVRDFNILWKILQHRDYSHASNSTTICFWLIILKYAWVFSFPISSSSTFLLPTMRHTLAL